MSQDCDSIVNVRGVGEAALSLQTDLVKRSISRRGVLTLLMGATAGVGGLKSAPNAEAAVLPPVLDPEWVTLVEFAQDNSTNQAVLFKPGKGLVITFCDHLYHFDLRTNTFDFFSEQTKVLSGNSSQTTTVNTEIAQIAQSFTEIDTSIAANGESVRLRAAIESIDANNYQINIGAGLRNRNPTFWLSTIYNLSMGFFPSGFQISGTPPAFDFTLIEFAASLVARRPFPRMFRSVGVRTNVSPGSPPQGGDEEADAACSLLGAGAHATIRLAEILANTEFAGAAAKLGLNLYAKFLNCLFRTGVRT